MRDPTRSRPKSRPPADDRRAPGADHGATPNPDWETSPDMPSTITSRRWSTRATALAAAVTAAVALAAAAGQASADVGQPPPEWAANAGAWPAHNYDLANTRATTQTPI